MGPTKRKLRTMNGSDPRSTLQIGGHAIHTMLIPFPIAFFIGT